MRDRVTTVAMHMIRRALPARERRALGDAVASGLTPPRRFALCHSAAARGDRPAASAPASSWRLGAPGDGQRRAAWGAAACRECAPAGARDDAPDALLSRLTPRADWRRSARRAGRSRFRGAARSARRCRCRQATTYAGARGARSQRRARAVLGSVAEALGEAIDSAARAAALQSPHRRRAPRPRTLA